MKRDESEDDDMREEYDFSNSVRSPYAARYREGTRQVLLDADVSADVSEAFPDSQSLNEALRVLIKAAKSVKDLPKAS